MAARGGLKRLRDAALWLGGLFALWQQMHVIQALESETTGKQRYVLHIVADDLGYNDVNWRNKQSISPALDGLVKDGLEIPEFYVYKFCAASRSSILTGRYPYHLGMYNNNVDDVPLSYKLLPQLLQQQPPPGGPVWRTHALGKWHLGWVFLNYTATWRGFDTFYGTRGNTNNYWQHTQAGTGPKSHGRCIAETPLRDFIDVKGKDVALAPQRAYGTYDSRVLTQRTLSIVANHSLMDSLYVYLAFHNVHGPEEAPEETVSRLSHIKYDRRKVADAMLTELDYGVGNVTDLMKSRQMWDSSLVIFHTDNGGPEDHACNYPLRGYKFGVWEGSVRGVAFVSGGIIPAARRGKQFVGMMHEADWYFTLTSGLAGLSVPANTGPLPPDSLNVWQAITTGSASPRNEVVTLPLSNPAVNVSAGPGGGTSPCSPDKGCATSFRQGKWKIIIGDAGPAGMCHLEPPSKTAIKFGDSGGFCNLGGVAQNCAAGGSAPDWGWNYNQTFPQYDTTCQPYCIFNVEDDAGETRNLASTPAGEAAAEKLLARLQVLSRTGVPMVGTEYPGPNSKGYKQQLLPIICEIANETGYFLPADWPVRVSSTEKSR